jgi:hypothetical protein
VTINQGRRYDLHLDRVHADVPCAEAHGFVRLSRGVRRGLFFVRNPVGDDAEPVVEAPSVAAPPGRAPAEGWVEPAGMTGVGISTASRVLRRGAASPDARRLKHFRHYSVHRAGSPVHTSLRGNLARL